MKGCTPRLRSSGSSWVKFAVVTFLVSSGVAMGAYAGRLSSRAASLSASCRTRHLSFLAGTGKQMVDLGKFCHGRSVGEPVEYQGGCAKVSGRALLCCFGLTVDGFLLGGTLLLCQVVDRTHHFTGSRHGSLRGRE
jgi:hypothetical protein